MIFKVNTDGSGYAVLKTFGIYDGGNPAAGVVLAPGTLRPQPRGSAGTTNP